MKQRSPVGCNQELDRLEGGRQEDMHRLVLVSNLEDKLEVGLEPEVDTQDPLPPREGKVVDSLRHRVMTAAAATPGIEDTLKTVVVEVEPVVAGFEAGQKPGAVHQRL